MLPDDRGPSRDESYKAAPRPHIRAILPLRRIAGVRNPTKRKKVAASGFRCRFVGWQYPMSIVMPIRHPTKRKELRNTGPRRRFVGFSLAGIRRTVFGPSREQPTSTSYRTCCTCRPWSGPRWRRECRCFRNRGSRSRARWTGTILRQRPCPSDPNWGRWRLGETHNHTHRSPALQVTML